VDIQCICTHARSVSRRFHIRLYVAVSIARATAQSPQMILVSQVVCYRCGASSATLACQKNPHPTLPLSFVRSLSPRIFLPHTRTTSSLAHVVSILQGGCFFGALLGAPLSERIGRRKALIVRSYAPLANTYSVSPGCIYCISHRRSR
jgi:MFS family permease